MVSRPHPVPRDPTRPSPSPPRQSPHHGREPTTPHGMPPPKIRNPRRERQHPSQWIPAGWPNGKASDYDSIRI
ncbi:hypothetical protein CCHR01_12548 [Colletotrichum chrysophilum]|uniref:Uncharacterized protein n=1 Tax=Colletotrichum chrysophilum TaxID=1836956 RepID=A0AAD9ADW9_9PEZI|nr:hypothetical protein CCHR01_12548 [Colletotrichum chrysophilum]